MTNAYTCNRLVEEAKNIGVDLKIIGIHDTMITKEGAINEGKLLEKRDFLINRYKWGKEKDFINGLVTRSYNPLEQYNIYINKYEQVSRLHSDAFLIPKYVLGTSLFPYEQLTETLGTPIVGKGLESAMGEEIGLISSKGHMVQQRNGSLKSL